MCKSIMVIIFFLGMIFILEVKFIYLKERIVGNDNYMNRMI